MKVRISYVVDVDDDLRRAMNEYHGQPGLASRDEVKRWYMLRGFMLDDDLRDGMDDDS